MRPVSVTAVVVSVLAIGTGAVIGAQDTGCDECGWYVGAGVYYLTPNWSTNPAYASTRVITGVSETRQNDFNYGPSVVPLVWFGYRGEGRLGFEARAWSYDDSESVGLTNEGGGMAVNSAAPLGTRNTSTTAGDTLTFDSALRVDVFDLLGTYQGQVGKAILNWGAGFRRSKIKQEYNHLEDPAANDLLDRVNSAHEFEGAGPIFAFRGKVAFTERFSAQADLRYAILFGDFDQRSQLTNDNVLVLNREYSTDDTLSVAEIEIGAEYAFSRFFVKGAVVGQIWPGAGNSANNDVITVLIDPEVADTNADMAFVGLQLAAGVRF
jgi:hypothetical protein